MLKLDLASPLEERKETIRKLFFRTGDSGSDEHLLGEDLSDVVIEVYPDADTTGLEASESPDTDAIAAARIPAHSMILANRSKYFHSLLTNGMAQSKTTNDPQVEDSAGSKVISPSDRRSIQVKIKGYPLPVIRYFIGHLYNNQPECEQQKITLDTDWAKILRIADEFGVLSLFDKVSITLLTALYSGQYREVVQLLQFAYEFSKETSQILRKGCITYCTENYPTLSKKAKFKEFLRDHACRDLLFELVSLIQDP
ncbi:hypothetical protein DFS34DRAFT_649716 [Phlyctochytrium arcticum]|nr:hypothetical protein DFS34DRAFT_649716 [Phlyctochytrium arcticum]